MNYLKSTYSILFFLLLTGQIFAQSGSLKPSNQKAVEDDITVIRTIYQDINKLKLTKQQFKYESSGCVEEGVVNYFLNNKEIVKITESGSIGDGSWSNEYYYKAGQLVFCFETIVGGPAIGKVTTTKYRYNFKNNRLLREMEDNKIIPADSKATEKQAAGTKIYKAYQTKDFAGALCN